MGRLFLVTLMLVSSAACADVDACVATGDAVEPVILVLGDSLSAGYGIDIDESWVALLESRLADRGYKHRVVNASISGDTTSGGLARLNRALAKHRPALVVIELGGNDGLRGLPLSVIAGNFDAMIEQSKSTEAEVVLLGMRIPPNYGPRYTEKFREIYRRLAERHELAWIEFFLDGIALDPGLMQADGVHPNAAAQPRLLANAWPAIESALAAGCD